MNSWVDSLAVVENGTVEIPDQLNTSLRRADDFTRLAVATANAAIKGVDLSCGRSGLILGTAFGPMQTNFNVLDQLIHKHGTSPTQFTHSVFNTAAGYISKLFGIKDTVITMTNFHFPFFHALQHGNLLVTKGLLDQCLIIQAETFSNLLHDSRNRIGKGTIKRWQAGGVAWLLTRNSRSGWCLDYLKVKTESPDTIQLLFDKQNLRLQSTKIAADSSPLAIPALLTQRITNNSQTLVDCTINSSCGVVRMSLRRDKP